ncbi:hypothetical protein SD427_11620 [Chryseobacterium sp. JJR-5R]|uniref:hypothetical protein n=1 Tax=Chryseobacterium sp. JJR-5R TaxID=3093923 RepID=UPI002A75DFEA|nr:hypothetical protein [Chryseobacterium sp. JJR-5R]WPO81412.1 hypothetical protein SD427_11620 [Chryseobacterium sp. JJR-5R]
MNIKLIPFEFTSGNIIEFKNNLGINPLMPLVQSSYHNQDHIAVSANIFINAEVSISQDNIRIIQDSENEFLFFIEYSKDSKPNSVKIFRNYRLDFMISNINAENNYNEIIVYLKDDDPTLSRGTVTTVQHNV